MPETLTLSPLTQSRLKVRDPFTKTLVK